MHVYRYMKKDTEEKRNCNKQQLYMHIKYICAHVKIHACVHMYLFMYIHIRMQIYTYIHICIYTYVYIYIHMYIYIYVYTINIHATYIYIYVCVVRGCLSRDHATTRPRTHNLPPFMGGKHRKLRPRAVSLELYHVGRSF